MDDSLVQNIHKQKKLPIEIIYIILVYLRQPQDAKLLADILHFSKTMTIITNNYYKRWIVIRELKEVEDIIWLENDIILYANEYAPTCIGLKPKFKEIINRLCTVKNRMNIFTISSCSNKISPKTKVNILWGLFTIAERDDFIRTNMDI
jgi:hypothetical protein